MKDSKLDITQLKLDSKSKLTHSRLPDILNSSSSPGKSLGFQNIFHYSLDFVNQEIVAKTNIYFCKILLLFCIALHCSILNIIAVQSTDMHYVILHRLHL